MSILSDDQLNQYRQQFLASSTPQAPATPAPRRGFLGRVSDLGNSVVQSTAQAFQDVGGGLGTALGSNSALNAVNEANKADEQNMKHATALYKAGKLSKDQYIGILNNASDITQSSEITNQIADKVSAKKTLAGAAQIAALVVAPELSGLKLAPGIAANAGLGGIIGGASSIENNGSAADVARNTLLGGAIGGGLSAGGAGVRGILNRVASRATPATTAPAVASATAPIAQDLSPEARQAALQQFRTQAAAASPAVPQAVPQVISKPGPTVLDSTPHAVAPTTTSAIAAPAPAPPPVAPAVAPPTQDITSLFNELQTKTNNVLTRQTAAPALHEGIAQPSGVLPTRPTAAPSFTPVEPATGTAEQAAKMGLPEGYTATARGDAFSPSGKPLTIADQQTLAQPRFLTDFENAHNAGDVETMQKIAAAHPGDARVNAPGLGIPPEAAPELGGNALQKMGRSINNAGVRVRTAASPFGARREAELQQFLRDEKLLKAGANPEKIYRQLPTKFSDYQSQIGKLVANDTTPIAAADLKAEIKAAVSKDSTVRGMGRKQAEIINNINKIVDSSADKNGNLKAAQIYQIKQTLNTDLDAAYKRLQKGAGLNEADQTSMTARDIVNGKLPTAARDLGKKESNLHDLAVILDADRKLNMNMPTALTFGLPHSRGSTGIAHAMESLYTGIGTPIEKIGNATAGISSALQGGGGMLSRVAGRGAAPLSELANSPAMAEAAPLAAAGAVNMPAAPQQPADQVAPMDGATPNDSGLSDLVSQVQSGRQDETAQQSTNQFGLTSADLDNAMIEDLFTTGGANLAKLGVIRSLLQDQEKAQQPQTINQTAVNQINTIQRAQSGLDQIEAAFGKTRGTGKGILSKIEASPVGTFAGGQNVQNVNKSIQANLTSIATALGMGTSNRELEALSAQLPNTSDTQASAKAKLGVIRGQINQYLQQYLSNQSNYVQPTNNTLDALAQLSAGGDQT